MIIIKNFLHEQDKYIYCYVGARRIEGKKKIHIYAIVCNAKWKENKKANKKENKSKKTR